MTTYYIRADVHSNSTELAIERNKRIMARHKVPTTIVALSVETDHTIVIKNTDFSA